MKSNLLATVAVALLLCAASAGAANLTVGSPGLGPGTSATCPSGCKLEVNLVSDTAKAFVISDHPSSERVFRFSFYLDVNALTIPAGTAVRFAELRKLAPDGRIILFVSTYYRSGKHKIRFQGFNEDNSQRAVCGFDIKTSGFSKFEVELELASGLGTSDGFVTVTKGTNVKGITDWNLYLDGTNGVDQVRFGVVKNPSTLLNGTFFLDDFESFRTLAPAP